MRRSSRLGRYPFCHAAIAPLGILAFAACGKDEGWNPDLILDEAARSAHYSRKEILSLDWSGPIPDFAALKMQWREALRDGRAALEILPPQHVGCALLEVDGTLFSGDAAQLALALQGGEVRFHAGHIGGVWPSVGSEREAI